MRSIEFRKYFLLVVVVGFIIAGVSGCAGQKQSLRWAHQQDNLYKAKVKDYVKKGTPSDSEQAILPATNAELERSGDLLFSRGNLHMAFVEYEKCLKEDPKNTRILCKKGMLFLAGNLNDEAVKIFDEVLKLNPGYAIAHEGTGRALFQTKRYDEAQKRFKKALALNPNLWKSRNYLAMVYDFQHKYELARCHYAEALYVRPDDGYLYNNLGVSFAMAGEYKKAVNAFTRALEITEYSQKDKTYNNLGLVLSKLGRYEDALEAFKKSGSDTQAFNNLGCVHLERGEADKAMACFEAAVRSSPVFDVTACENLKRARMSYNQTQ